MGFFDEIRVEGSFDLSSGRKTEIFYDFDLLRPRETANYVEMLLKEVPKNVMQQVHFFAAPALGGIVPGFLFGFSTDKPLIIVEPGTVNLRGPKVEGGNYLIVDDVCTSFTTANKVRAALPECRCLGVAAFIFRGSAKDKKESGLPLYYLSRKEEEI